MSRPKKELASAEELQRILEAGVALPEMQAAQKAGAIPSAFLSASNLMVESLGAAMDRAVALLSFAAMFSDDTGKPREGAFEVVKGEQETGYGGKDVSYTVYRGGELIGTVVLTLPAGANTKYSNIEGGVRFHLASPNRQDN